MTSRSTATAIALFAAAQVFSATYGLGVAAPVCPFLFLGSGTAIAFLLLRLPAASLRQRGPTGSVVLFLLATLCVLLTTGYFVGAAVIHNGPLTVEQADMLPIIKVMGGRFAAGDWRSVYEPIPEIWNGVQPIYPPVLWGSFLPAVAFGFDLRWITLAGIILSSVLCLYPLAPTIVSNKVSSVLLAAMAVLLAWLYTNESHNVIRLTEEGVVYFWYCVLVYAVASNNPWAIGVAAALCMLTRYAAAGWLPALAVYWWVAGERARLLKTIAAGTATVLWLLVLPFGWKPVQVMLSLPGNYVAHAQNVWDAFPAHFHHSPGMAKFFGQERAAALHYTLIISSVAVPLLLVVYARRKQRTTGIANVPLALLVLALTVFYAFVDVSYLYLYYTPIFVTLAVAAVVGVRDGGATVARSG